MAQAADRRADLDLLALLGQQRNRLVHFHVLRAGLHENLGEHAVVIGRSNTVGKPMALLLLQSDATVTVCHSATPDLGVHTRQADIVVAAVGRAGTLTADMVKSGAIVIDVGINRRADGRLCGDVDFDAGVGPDVAGSVLDLDARLSRTRPELPRETP